MREYFITRASITDLLQNLNEDVRTFFKQEIKLVEKEMSEKVSRLGRDAMILGIGNYLVGTGSTLLLAGLGFLLAFAFQKAGLDTLLAMVLGFALIGLVVTIVGAAICVKGIKAISKHSLTPQRTIHTVTGSEIPPVDIEPSAAELHREALATKQRIGGERHELGHRLTPPQLMKSALDHIRRHPLSWSAGALACVVTGSYFIGRKFWRA